MTTFIFCLIFIQVAIFLAVGAVLFTTFYAGVSRGNMSDETVEALISAPVLEPATEMGN